MTGRALHGFVLAALLGAGFCLWSYGPIILDGSAIDWLMAGDRAQSFLGWHLYRSSPESFPLGRIPALLHPIGASLAYTDSFPWFSLALKPLSTLLPDTWQISGWWLLLCYALLAGFGFLVLHLLVGDLSIALAGSVLIVMSPVLTRRGGHISLCAQWLLLAAFYLLLRSRDDRRLWPFVGPWSILLCLAAGTHPYLAAMVLAIALAACANGTPLCALRLRQARGDETSRAWPVLLAQRCCILLLVTASALYAFGYVGAPSVQAEGFGTYSANLLTLADPADSSRFLPTLPATTGQYEGFGYLGTGVLAVLALAAVLRTIVRGSVALQPPPSRPLARAGELRLVLVVVVTMAAFALSSSIKLGTVEVASAHRLYARLEPLPSIFRSSGRFVWPLHYAMIVAAVTWLATSIRRRSLTIAILLAAIGLQLWDQRAFYAGNDAAAFGRANAWKRLRSPLWMAAGDDYAEIKLVPPYVHDAECPRTSHPAYFYVPFAYAAGLLGMRINSGHLSRQPEGEVARLCRSSEDEIAVGHVDPDAIYVVSDEVMPRFVADDLGLARCGVLDGFNVCVSTRRATPFSTMLPSHLGAYGACSDIRARPRPANARARAG